MSDTPPIRLEQGTALSLLWETADDLRQSAADLHAAAEAHAMSTFAFLRDFADGGAPDPSSLLRTRGQLEGLLNQLTDRVDTEAAHLAELHVALLPPNQNDELEARALAAFQERYRRRGREPLPEDPRPVEEHE